MRTQAAPPVNRADREPRDLADAQARSVGRRQRRPIAQAGDRLQKPHDLVGAQHHRQFLRLAGGGRCVQKLRSSPR